jgi:hypothetical protein
MAILVIFVIAFFLQSLFPGMNLNQILLKYKRTFYFILLLLTLGTLVALSFKEDALFSRPVLIKFAREFLNSTIFFAVLWMVWAILNKPTIVKRSILTALLGLLVNMWYEQSFTWPKSTDFRALVASEYKQLEWLLGKRFLKISLAVCQILTIFSADNSETYLIFYDEQDLSAKPIAILINDSNTEYLSESIKEEKKRLIDFIPEETFLFEQLST